LTTVPLNGFASFAVLFLGRSFAITVPPRRHRCVFWPRMRASFAQRVNLGIAYRFGWTAGWRATPVLRADDLLGFPPKRSSPPWRST